MKPILNTLLAAAALTYAMLCNAADLEVSIANVRSAAGRLTVSLYGSADSFLKTPIRVASAVAAQGETRVVFKDIAVGDYALSVYHDENGNGKLDRGSMGLPAEPYGFGNDALGEMGPPSFEKARVAVTASGASTTVTLK